MDNKKEIKAAGSAFSATTVLIYVVFVIGIKFGSLILVIPLLHFFPFLKEYDWLRILPEIFIFVFLLTYTLCSVYSVILQPDMMILKWFGLTIRKIPLSEIHFFCAFGNGRENILCFSRYTAEEMALMQEKRLLRGVFSKHEVPFRKRKANWQDDFAKEYLNRLHRKAFLLFRNRETVTLELQPFLQYALRKMYPQLPYKNFTGIHSPHISRFSEIPENRAVCLVLQANEYEFRMETDGIHLETTKKEEVSFLPAEQIKTVIRVDIFPAYSKIFPPHMPLLFITTMSEEELAKQPAAKGYSVWCLNETDDQALSALTSASYLAWKWNKSKKDSCLIPHTEKNLETLRAYYPHIQINEISTDWMREA